MHYKIEYKFAWLPVYLRNSFKVLGTYPVGKWSWLCKYTRVFVWSEKLGRWRTIDTYKGHYHHEDYKGELQ